MEFNDQVSSDILKSLDNIETSLFEDPSEICYKVGYYKDLKKKLIRVSKNHER